jgi:hypothetical protein
LSQTMKESQRALIRMESDENRSVHD